MPTPEWKREVNARPRWALPNYRSLPPVVPLVNYESDRSNGIWNGSGFQIEDLPCYRGKASGYCHDAAKVCGSCGSSTETACLFLWNVMDQSGADIQLEIECRRCGKFTTYNGFA